MDLKDEYLDNLTVNRYIGDTEGPASLLKAIDPQMVYHAPTVLWQFYDEYKTRYGTDLYLYLGHGSLHKSPDLPKDSLRHSPVLFFGDDTHFFFLDDEDHGDVFRNRAFDAGRLCPPRCPSTAPSTCHN